MIFFSLSNRWVIAAAAGYGKLTVWGGRAYNSKAGNQVGSCNYFNNKHTIFLT